MKNNGISLAAYPQKQSFIGGRGRERSCTSAIADTLEKRTYKDLYYIGLDLKTNSIPIEKLQKLQNLELLNPPFQAGNEIGSDSLVTQSNILTGEIKSQPSTQKPVVENHSVAAVDVVKRKRGRPRKVEKK